MLGMLRAKGLGSRRRLPLSALCSVVIASAGCGHSGSQAPARTKYVATAARSALTRRKPPLVRATQLDGQKFPDHVLAVTWDDGPDKHTVELARFLSSKHVSGTFFVVNSWQKGLSDEPGTGKGAFETGFAHLPVLEDLVRLGQRVANHTLNHVLLPSVEPELAQRQLAQNQHQIDAFLPAEVRFFRAPAGAWNADVARLASQDPYLGQLIGPIRWDIDRKDWESSVECQSKVPARDCESGHDGLRLKPRVTARRYLETIERQRHGIVLLHDRVGDVGSEYALDVARALVPELIARGYVFAAPVLGFSQPVERASAAARDALAALALADLELIDSDGDGRADLCGRAAGQRYCLRSQETPGGEAGQTPKAFFNVPVAVASTAPPRKLPRSWNARRGALADIDGDGHADACWSSADGVRCALWRAGALAQPRLWLTSSGQKLLFGDLNGDRRADVCFESAEGVSCAFSTGSAFTASTSWLSATAFDAGSRLALGDINGDGRADLCGVHGGQVSCGLTP